MRKTIYEFEAQTLAQFIEQLTALKNIGAPPDEVYIEAQTDGELSGGRILEETLSDGSKVYCVQFC